MQALFEETLLHPGALKTAREAPQRADRLTPRYAKAYTAGFW